MSTGLHSSMDSLFSFALGKEIFSSTKLVINEVVTGVLARFG